MIKVDEQGLKLINILMDIALKVKGIEGIKVLDDVRKGLTVIKNTTPVVEDTVVSDKEVSDTAE